MASVEQRQQREVITIFVPSSPTPFTGYTIMVSEADTIDLPISIDDALRFTVSGGVILPQSQLPRNLPDDNPSPDNP